jgi:PAS domain-containing protein
MSSDTTASRSAPTNGGTAPGLEAAEHERQFREMLELCPAALLVVDDEGRLLFHNARLREILGYSKDERTSHSVQGREPLTRRRF